MKTKFSDGRLTKFKKKKKKRGLQTLKIYGESENVDDNALQDVIAAVKNCIANFETGNVWNADRFVSFYKLLSNFTVATQCSAGQKTRKNWVSAFFCCTNEGLGRRLRKNRPQSVLRNDNHKVYDQLQKNGIKQATRIFAECFGENGKITRIVELCRLERQTKRNVGCKKAEKTPL